MYSFFISHLLVDWMCSLSLFFPLCQQEKSPAIQI
nr:MAG TPA: hypothetical protein [Caudoviricetes sp.]